MRSIRVRIKIFRKLHLVVSICMFTSMAILGSRTFRNFLLPEYRCLKDADSTAPKKGSVFIGLMTPDGAIWSRDQRAVLMW